MRVSLGKLGFLGEELQASASPEAIDALVTISNVAAVCPAEPPEVIFKEAPLAVAATTVNTLLAATPDAAQKVTTELNDSVKSNHDQAQARESNQKLLAAVTNSDFIAAVFHNIPAGASALVCSKYGDPTEGPWPPKSAAQVHGCASNTNNYVNCASFKPDTDGTLKARKDNAVAFHCLVLDDVGTKVAMTLLSGVKVSWAIETSPGNYQVGFILAEPLTNEAEVLRLQNAVIAAGLSDPGAKGMARWMRLPVAINGKEKYRTETGKRFQCQLRRWNPEFRYTVYELVEMLKLDLDAALTPEPHDATDTEARTYNDAELHEREFDPALIAQINELLAKIDPDLARGEWIKAMMAVHHETGGSDDGLTAFDAYSRRGSKYKGLKDVETQWRSLKKNPSKPYTMGTLIWMARNAGADTHAIMQDSTTPPKCAPGTASPLTRFSLKDSLAELEKQRVEQRLILGNIVLLGQATVIYAMANTGKTLIVLHLIMEAAKKGTLDPAKIYYINMDDNSSGLIDKARLSHEYGFHMLADGHKKFAANEFRLAMEEMTENNSASGVVVVIDTLKKFVNTMNKEASSDFARVVRQFVLKGGTVIALSHVNKNPGADGKVKYTGTTDIVDDFDCAYTLQVIPGQDDTGQKLVEFANFKRRGDVAETAAYSYSTQRGLSYNELLTSVQEVDPDQVEPLKQAAELASDAPVVAIIEVCIAEGINTKMKMVDAVSKRANVSMRIALKVIEKYTGEDVNVHYWRFVVVARGAQVFELLKRPQESVPAEVFVDAPKSLEVTVSAKPTDLSVGSPASRCTWADPLDAYLDLKIDSEPQDSVSKVGKIDYSQMY